MKEFLERKNVIISFKVYGIDVLGKMAFGLFASLLIGTILNTIGQRLGIKFLTETIWPIARDMTGPCIAVAIGTALKAPNLVLFASVIPGFYANSLGGPVGVLVAAVLAIELGKIVSQETPIDIILTPMIVIVVGCVVGHFLGKPLNLLMTGIGDIVIAATELRPFLMGTIVSVVVGMVLTLPISSAALCMMLSLSGLAGGAATAGCCAQMIGFAVISYRDNKLKGLLAQGLGTSMLQIPNIMKNWKIWIPPTVASLIAGPFATVIFQMKNSPLGSGMGTAGLVGIIETINTMAGKSNPWMLYGGIICCYVIVPALVSYVTYEILRHKRWIKDGDMLLKE